MKLLIIFFLVPLRIFAQDITGLWKGFIHTTDKNLPYELAISENNGKLGGYSHTTFTLNGAEEIGVKAITIKNKKGNVLVEDEALVFNDFSIAPVKGIRQFDYLVLIVEDTLMMLNGTFKTNKIRDYRSISGTIELRKIDTTQKTKIIPKLNELNLLSTLSFLHTKPKEKEVAAIETASVKKVKADIPIKKETEISISPIIKEQSSVVQPPTKEVAKVTPSEKEKKPGVILQPEAKERTPEVVLQSEKPKEAVTTISEKEKKSEVIPQPKPKEVAIVPSFAKEKKPEVVLQSEVKPKEVVTTTSEKEKKSEIIPQSKPKEAAILASSEKEKKSEIVIQPKTKQAVNIPPPTSIKKSQPIPQPQERQKELASSKTATVKKEQRDTLLDAKRVVTVSQPLAIKPVQVPVVSAAEVTKRKTEMIQSVFFKSDSLLLSLYDNGEVDGDTVSVVLNGKVIIASQGLSTSAITKTVYATPDLGDSLQLVMYAENLGSIPPNTGLLILQDGADRYEIRFAGDFQKNSAIILRRKKN